MLPSSRIAGLVPDANNEVILPDAQEDPAKVVVGRIEKTSSR